MKFWLKQSYYYYHITFHSLYGLHHHVLYKTEEKSSSTSLIKNFIFLSNFFLFHLFNDLIHHNHPFLYSNKISFIILIFKSIFVLNFQCIYSNGSKKEKRFSNLEKISNFRQIAWRAKFMKASLGINMALNKTSLI